ncbi:hypothetical protein [Clostridium sp. JN-1]|jgi:hypothetical protein|uniref:hypothetical protein n=1 Tax=Clostridium sp. JN-1 TaxID=2483110 RepID=UPI000F0B8862|nr:hypothetical protein [Clostridium sp. JN-1]
MSLKLIIESMAFSYDEIVSEVLLYLASTTQEQTKEDTVKSPIKTEKAQGYEPCSVCNPPQ